MSLIGHRAILQAPVNEKGGTTRQSKTKMTSLLPEKCASNRVITEYLFGRGIDFEIINYCISNDLIFESLPYHNVVFVGYDEKKEPKYAAYRSTNKRRIMGDCSGSKKDYSFRWHRITSQWHTQRGVLPPSFPYQAEKNNLFYCHCNRP